MYSSKIDSEFKKAQDWYALNHTLSVDGPTASMQQTFIIVGIYTINEFLIEYMFENYLEQKINLSGGSLIYKNREIKKVKKIISNNHSGNWANAFIPLLEQFFPRVDVDEFKSQIKDNPVIDNRKRTINNFHDRRNKKVHTSLNYFEHTQIFADYDHTKLNENISYLIAGFKEIGSELTIFLDSKL